MIGILGLSTHTCKVTRITEARSVDGDPVALETVTVSALPCRLDQTRPGNLIRGDVRSVDIVGRLFIDASAVNDDGTTFQPKYKDKYTVGDMGPYEALEINPVWGMFSLHHWEIDLLDTANR